DIAAHFGADRTRLVDHVRDGRVRHSRQGCDVLDGRHGKKMGRDQPASVPVFMGLTFYALFCQRLVCRNLLAFCCSVLAFCCSFLLRFGHFVPQVPSPQIRTPEDDRRRDEYRRISTDDYANDVCESKVSEYRTSEK